MPKPLYILVSDSGAIDKITNQVSLFNVVDTVMLSVPHDAPENIVPAANLRLFIVSSWHIEDSDINTEHEAQMLVEVPGVEGVGLIYEDKLKFSKSLHRFTIRMNNELHFPAGGTMKIVNRIKPAEGGDWVSQSYNLIVKIDREPPQVEKESNS